jgi:hypothetical protein
MVYERRPYAAIVMVCDWGPYIYTLTV